jgi:hypothetical protein
MILRSHTDAMAGAIPGAKEIIVPGASHMGPLEQPETYNAMVLSPGGLHCWVACRAWNGHNHSAFLGLPGYRRRPRCMETCRRGRH